MAKWKFALLVFLSMGAQASGPTHGVGGCIVLNEIIYEEVTASGWGMTGADLVFTNFREPSAVVCTGNPQAAGAMPRVTAIDPARLSRYVPRDDKGGAAGMSGDRSPHSR
jgi:hypothetical protein